MSGFRDVTEAELAVMQALWERGSATIRDLADLVYPGGRASEYATVQKLLDRLEAKGYVARDRSAAAHRFEPLVARDQLVGRRLEALVEGLCEGSIAPVLSHLLRSPRLRRSEMEELRALVARLERGSRGSGPRRPEGEEKP